MSTEWDWAMRDLEKIEKDLVIVKRIGEKFRSILEDVNTLTIGGVLVLEKDIKWDTYPGFIETQVKNSDEAIELLNKEKARLTKFVEGRLKLAKEKELELEKER